MEDKKTTKISLSTFFLILAIIAIIAMGIFMFKLIKDKDEESKKISELEAKVNSLSNENSQLQKQNTIQEPSVGPKTGNENSEQTSTNQNVNTTPTKNKSLESANITDKIKNQGTVGETTYEIGTPAMTHTQGLDVVLENSKVYFKLTDKNFLNNYYSSINRVENQKEEITGFNGTVKEVYFYQIGQALTPKGSAILFLMEDGTIEYLSYADALQTTNLSSRGVISGLYDITEIYSGASRDWVDQTGGPGWQSCIAKDSNNNYYDIELVFKHNNIDLSKVN